MKYWALTAPGSLTLTESHNTDVPEGFAKVKVQLAAVTSSDIDAYLGNADNYPLIIGRQAVGFISEVAENDRKLERGQRAVIDPRISCGACYACKNGRPQVCENSKFLGINASGMLSDFALIPIRNIYALPPHVKNEDALFTEPVALANRAFAETNMSRGAHAAIFGASSLGLIIAQVLMYQQVIPVVIDSRAENLELAKKLGIYYTLNSSEVSIAAQIKQLTGGRLCEYSVYLSFGGEKIQDALDSLQHGGTMVVTGYSEAINRANIKPGSIFSKQLKIIGINNGGKHIESAINLIAKHEINTAAMPAVEASFEDAADAIKEYSEAQNFLKRLVVKF